MKQITLSVSSVAVLALALVGCSHNPSNSQNGTTTHETTHDGTTETTTVISSSSDATGAKVTVDGQESNLDHIACLATGGGIHITAGEGLSAVDVDLGEGDDPQVRTVTVGNVNGGALHFDKALGKGNATAHKSDNTYTVTGTGHFVTPSNIGDDVQKPFTIIAHCP